MAALTEDRMRRSRNDQLSWEPRSLLVADTYYYGAILVTNAAGKQKVATDTADEIFHGIYIGPTLTLTADTLNGDVRRGHQEWIPIEGATLTAANIGDIVLAFDDGSITNDTTGTNNQVGELIEIESVGGVSGGWVNTGKNLSLTVAP